MQQMGYMTQPFLAGQYPTAMVRLLSFKNSLPVHDQVVVVCTCFYKGGNCIMQNRRKWDDYLVFLFGQMLSCLSSYTL